MCIRDRSYLAAAAEFVSRQMGMFAETKETEPAAFRRIFGCLLYTSDAADERSSVDLGGRRIIKKKKTNNSNETHYP